MTALFVSFGLISALVYREKLEEIVIGNLQNGQVVILIQWIVLTVCLFNFVMFLVPFIDIMKNFTARFKLQIQNQS